MSALALTSPGEPWRALNKLLNVISRRRCSDDGVPGYRRAVFSLVIESILAMDDAEKSWIEQLGLRPADGYARSRVLLELMVIQAIDRVAQARGLMIARSRRRRGLPRADVEHLEEIQSPEDGPTSDVESQEEMKWFDGAIANLADGERAAFLMRANGRPVDEIAEELGIGRTTVYELLKKAKAALAAQLKAHRGDI